jgi:hypothetical protein
LQRHLPLPLAPGALGRWEFHCKRVQECSIMMHETVLGSLQMCLCESSSPTCRPCHQLTVLLAFFSASGTTPISSLSSLICASVRPPARCVPVEPPVI